MKLIAIVDADFGISKDEKIPWSFSRDLKFFKSSTMGSAVIMGRKTFLSLKKPLEGRINCVISHSIKSHPGFVFFPSLEAAARKYPNAWLIGGGELYKYALEHDFINEAFITIVHKSYAADKFLPSSFFKCFTPTILIEDQAYRIIKYSKPMQ